MLTAQTPISSSTFSKLPSTAHATMNRSFPTYPPRDGMGVHLAPSSSYNSYMEQYYTSRLDILQQPEVALVAVDGKEKTRKPIDPPPIVQLEIDTTHDPQQNYLSNPYLFMCANLKNADAPPDESKSMPGRSLTGTVVSSLHRLKDTKNKPGAFFVFSDMSARVAGKFYLEFSLYELRKETNEVVFLKSIISKPFQVVQPKDFPGLNESTFLSRAFSDQGVRLRLRKESRTAGQKRGLDARSDDSAHLPPAKRSEYEYAQSSPFPTTRRSEYDYPNSTPMHSTTLHSTPMHNTPMHNTPMQSVQMLSTPMQSAPMHSTPMHSTPMHSTPMPSTPVHPTSIPTMVDYRRPEYNLGQSSPTAIRRQDYDYGNTTGLPMNNPPPPPLPPPPHMPSSTSHLPSTSMMGWSHDNAQFAPPPLPPPSMWTPNWS